MKKMTKNTYSIDDKVEVARIIFTNIDMTTADLAEKAGIHLRTVSYWRDRVINRVPEYLQKTFGDVDDSISSEERAEATCEYLLYDCDNDEAMAEMEEDYGVSSEQIREWADSVIDNLDTFFVSKRGKSSKPMKSQRPRRDKVTDTGSGVAERLNAA